MGKNTNSWRMRWWQSLLGLLLVAGLGACSMPPPPSARTDSRDEVGVEVAAAVAPAPSSSSNARMAAPTRDAKAASTLGTQWGEGRESVTKVVQASRLTPDRPRAVGQMRYSDEDSIRRALGPYSERQLNALLADGDVELAIGAGQGRPVYRIFTSRGAQDYHVAGRSGDRYELIYINRSNRYYEVVATVDGLDVLSGKPGSVKSDGYLLRPGFDLPNVTFSHEQLDALAVGLSFAESLDDPVLAQAAREVRAMLQANMPDPTARKLADAPYFSLRRSTGAPSHAIVLRKAIRDRRLVQMLQVAFRHWLQRVRNSDVCCRIGCLNWKKTVVSRAVVWHKLPCCSESTQVRQWVDVAVNVLEY